MTTTATARFARQQKVGFFAEVTLEIEDHAETLIALRCSGTGFSSQGHVEEVPAVGYNDWKEGARIGVAFALSQVGEGSFSVTVTRIIGLSTDTNPTIVAAAAALATWKALAYTPAPELLARLEALAIASWHDPGKMPAFAG